MIMILWLAVLLLTGVCFIQQMKIVDLGSRVSKSEGRSSNVESVLDTINKQIAQLAEIAVDHATTMTAMSNTSVSITSTVSALQGVVRLLSDHS
jgi:hypothetical protein